MIHPALESKFLHSSKVCEVGRFTYGTPVFISYPSAERMKIGSFCSIGPNVTFVLGGEHTLTSRHVYPFDGLFFGEGFPPCESSRGSIVVGNDVWIGCGAIILSGVTVGDGAVVGAGTVVRKDVPPYTVVAGNPAAKIGERENPGVAWWEWELDRIKEFARNE